MSLSEIAYAGVRSPLFFILSLRLWQGGAGLLTTLLILRFLTPELQGWYYSFLGVAALYTLFDLGLSAVLLQVSAHTAVGLHWGVKYSPCGGSAAKFSALLGKAVRWYVLMAIVFLLLVLPGGYWFFSQQNVSTVAWHWPWLALCLFTAGSMVAMPFLSVLEGAGQILVVYRVRLVQAVLGSLCCWYLLVVGAELWATVMVSMLAVLCTSGWLLVRARSLLALAWAESGVLYDWRNEVWPLQWRLGVSWLCSYMITQINIPILFHMKGAVLAGQFGLSLTVVNTLGLISSSWIARHIPVMAQAVVEKNWKQIDDIFFRDLGLSIVVFAVGAMILLFGYLLIDGSPLVTRFLPFWPFVGLFVYTFVNLLVAAWATYLRSFRREPLLLPMVFCTLLIVPGVLVATHWYSINGMIAVLDGVYLFVLLPVSWTIWRRCKIDWRS
ncbi:hypothetical protein [Azonexus fungiphilus]|uniref:hypothetical protein n=1 Tax=Azonexus fungiphilus TaxID=146940 RepID=UPI00156B9B46|nr:hypothetical protein [Azonexus fungiphilus]NHC08160.1 hypothetical protein [Azonexus fungiphilus]